MGNQPAKVAFDVEQYARRVSAGSCFVCGFIEGRPGHQEHLVYENDDTVAFLNRYPTLLGYCLVAPKRHIESWVHDMEPAEFLGLQTVAHAVARAIAATVPTERMYSMSLGSQQGNAHLHWHLAPLPPGVPSHQQQFHAVMAENGILPVDEDSQAALAREIRGRVQI
jgi:histidine triad (HIT) family protein/ATP adenylyltransferase